MLVRPEHQVAYEDLVGLLRKHADKMSKEEFLAVAANIVGKIIALQNKATTSKDRALEIVGHNIELGNAEAIAMANKGELDL